MHGHKSTHDWDSCHLNPKGSNFKPEKLKAWNERNKSNSAAANGNDGPN